MKTGPRFLMLLAVPTLAVYVFAQSRTEQDSGNDQRVAPSVVVRGVGIGMRNVATTADVALCRTDGANLDTVLSGTGILRIEYSNGSVSQIDLSDVKKMTVTARPGR